MMLPPALIMLGAVLLEIRYPRIDPVLLELPGPFDLRWYGLMYVVGFTISYFLLRWMARQDFLRIDPDAIGDLLVWLVLGLIIGARLGYIIFYDAGRLAEDPGRIIRIWEGGLSFHGGLAGIIIAGYMFGRKHGIPFLNLADGIVLAAPFGIGAVRVANFINGELFGRVTTEAVPWAMRFPTDPVAIRALGADQARSLREREQIINQAYETSAWEAVLDQVPLRHPSQLYEAFLEGLVLAAILWGIPLVDAAERSQISGRCLRRDFSDRLRNLPLLRGALPAAGCPVPGAGRPGRDGPRSADHGADIESAHGSRRYWGPRLADDTPAAAGAETQASAVGADGQAWGFSRGSVHPCRARRASANGAFRSVTKTTVIPARAT